MTAQPHEPLAQAEFVAWELRQQSKHEFVDGHLYGFAGGTVRHAQIAIVLAERISPEVRPYRTVGSDVLIEMATSSRYADLIVTCDDRDDSNGHTIRFPKLIIEVLSESTADADLGPKLREYQAIETLEEYVTIDSRKRWAQVLRRENDRWMLTLPICAGLLELRSVQVILDLDTLYTIVGISA